jgi:hypothetical protein
MQLTAFRIFKYRNIEDSGLINLADRLTLRWSRLSEQIFRVDKWSLCRG